MEEEQWFNVENPMLPAKKNAEIDSKNKQNALKNPYTQETVDADKEALKQKEEIEHIRLKQIAELERKLKENKEKAELVAELDKKDKIAYDMRNNSNKQYNLSVFTEERKKVLAEEAARKNNGGKTRRKRRRYTKK